MCGDRVQPPQRTWHKDCSAIWALACEPKILRHHLEVFGGRDCHECGREPGLYIDHRRPLWSLDEEERRELRWWLPFNTQLLGKVCHDAKTRREAGDRARRDRSRRVAQRMERATFVA